MNLALQTHMQDDRGRQCVILDHLQYMTKVNINVEPEHENLPSFYWLPKLHKNRYGKRFIAASNRCTTKLLSKLLTACLVKITCHFREYCNGIIESVDSISRDEPDSPLTQYITNAEYLALGTLSCILNTTILLGQTNLICCFSSAPASTSNTPLQLSLLPFASGTPPIQLIIM